jgi:hypothetical protein
MARPRLIIFAGKPGIGKTAIIDRIKDGYRVIDIWPFMIPYSDPQTGVPPEEKNIFGYQDMYKHIAGLEGEEVILEIGTNYPEVNVREMVQLAKRYDVQVLLCDAPVEVIRARGQGRGYRYNASFELRLKRDFPNAYISEFQKTSLAYAIVNMEGSFEETLVRIKKQLGL